MKKLLVAIVLFFCFGCGGKSIDPGFTCQVIPATNCPKQNVWAQSCNPLLLHTPRVHLIFWGNWWVTNDLGTQASQLSEEWQTLADDPNFYFPMQEYGIGPGSLDGIFFTNWQLPSGAISDTYIQQELNREITGNELPAADDQSIYLIMLPSNSTAAVDGPGYSGYHSFTNNFAYAMIEYNSNANMSVTASHEIYEASTDTDTYSGYWAGSGTTEIGDNCGGIYYFLDGFVIQKVWSQQACKCVP